MTLNIAPFIEAQSDRIVADDLIAGPQTHVVERVEGAVQEGKKRLIVRLKGVEKPFMPCKGMARLLGHLWGPDAAKWIGNTMVIYRDPDVRFGADTPGGVRICAVSNIDKAVKVPIRTSQKSVKTYEVSPIKQAEQTSDDARAKAEAWAAEHIGAVNVAATLDSLDAVITAGAKAVAKLAGAHPDLHQRVSDAYNIRRAELTPDEQPGDQFDGAEWAE